MLEATFHPFALTKYKEHMQQMVIGLSLRASMKVHTLSGPSNPYLYWHTWSLKAQPCSKKKSGALSAIHIQNSALLQKQIIHLPSFCLSSRHWKCQAFGTFRTGS